MTAQGVAIVQVVATGILASSQGAALLSGLGPLARIREIDELEQRITVHAWVRAFRIATVGGLLLSKANSGCVLP
jgi:hypothetical protein